ncbi:MAG TPA: D-alanine--D-alanine ligase family protein [Polyangiaceae bacterium]|jgi:D-alanine-D-alanine ligase|nr:D-alanine--D-alanine ligase family protein [Polyangiaceae bacterium]
MGERQSGDKLRVAVVFGGRSAEHEISILSARFVVESLDRDRFEPVLIGIDKDGRWHAQDEAFLLGQARDPRLVKLDASAPEARLSPHPESDAESRPGALEIVGAAPAAIDVVFPVLHGPMGEDGTIQGLFTLADVAFVGSGVLGSAVGMDKVVMKRLLRDAGLPLVEHAVVREHAWRHNKNELMLDLEELRAGGAVFVKPANLGSSVGVSRAKSREEVERGVEAALEYDDKIVIERGVPGVREIECAVLGNEAPEASCVGEIVVDHPDGFYSYAAKYVDEKGATVKIPAELDAEETDRVRTLAIETFRALECEGLARVDFFRSNAGEIFVNEVNTMPGFTAISMYPKLWEASGLGGKALVTRLIELAIERHARKRRRTSYG